MQVIAAPAASRGERLALARSAAVAALLILVAGLIAWTLATTPLLWSLIPAGRPTPAQVLIGIGGFAFAIVVPAAFLVLGVAKAAGTLEAVVARRPRRALPHLAHALGPEYLAAADVVLPDGRRIHELVLGPCGIVVLGDVPPASHSRHVGRRWEIRDARGRWIPVEPPVERAARDAERVRRWLAADEHDFLVKVYAAVVSADRRIERSSSCAVVAPDAFPSWLGNLPPQRGLTPARRDTVAQRIREAATPR